MAYPREGPRWTLEHKESVEEVQVTYELVTRKVVGGPATSFAYFTYEEDALETLFKEKLTRSLVRALRPCEPRLPPLVSVPRFLFRLQTEASTHTHTGGGVTEAKKAEDFTSKFGVRTT